MRAKIERRGFITLLGGAAAWPLAARGQEPGRTYRLGVLHQLPRTASQFARLFDGLRRQGFIEGRNLAVDPHGFGSSAQQYQERVAEMVQSGANVIFAGGERTLFEELSFQDVLKRNLRVMDPTAIAQCMEHDMPIVVFNYQKQGNIERAVMGEPIGTWVSTGSRPKPPGQAG